MKNYFGERQENNQGAGRKRSNFKGSRELGTPLTGSHHYGLADIQTDKRIQPSCFTKEFSP